MLRDEVQRNERGFSDLGLDIFVQAAGVTFDDMKDSFDLMDD